VDRVLGGVGDPVSRGYITNITKLKEYLLLSNELAAFNRASTSKHLLK